MRRNREVENERKGLTHFCCRRGAAVSGMVSAEHCGRSSWNDEDTSVRFPGKRVRYFRLQSEPYFYPLSDEKISGDR